MLESIWSVLSNYDLNVEEISAAINGLIEKLAPIMDAPVVGELLKALQSFAPVIETATEAATEAATASV